MYPYHYKNSLRRFSFLKRSISFCIWFLHPKFQIPHCYTFMSVKTKDMVHWKRFLSVRKINHFILISSFWSKKGSFYLFFGRPEKKFFLVVVLVGTLFEKFHCFWHTVPIWNWVLNFWFGGITVILHMQFKCEKIS